MITSCDCPEPDNPFNLDKPKGIFWYTKTPITLAYNVNGLLELEDTLPTAHSEHRLFNTEVDNESRTLLGSDYVPTSL